MDFCLPVVTAGLLEMLKLVLVLVKNQYSENWPDFRETHMFFLDWRTEKLIACQELTQWEETLKYCQKQGSVNPQ